MNNIDYYNIAVEKAPFLSYINKTYGDLSLDCYLQLIRHEPAGSIEPADELIYAVKNYLEPLTGSEIASAAAHTVDNFRCISTGNHHAVSFASHVVQGNILYDYLLRQMGSCTGIVPMFSFSTITLNNSHFPRGMLIYDNRQGGNINIPIIPSSRYNQMAAAAASFDNKMVNNAICKINSNFKDGNIDLGTRDTAVNIMQEVFLSDDVLNRNMYAEQVTIVNQKLSEHYFSDDCSRYIYINIEEIAKQLIVTDLKKENSILSRFLFDDKTRDCLVSELNDVAGCWSKDRKHGTMFFWGIDQKSRRFPLNLEYSNSEWFLSGIELSIPFNKETVMQMLIENKIVPCMFLSFLEVGILRDFTLLGGCYQSEYINHMINGVVNTYRMIGEHEREISILHKKRNFYILGIMYLMRSKNNYAYPLSTVELWEQPLKCSKICAALKITLQKSNDISTFRYYRDFVPKSNQNACGWKQIAERLGSYKNHDVYEK